MISFATGKEKRTLKFLVYGLLVLGIMFMFSSITKAAEEEEVKNGKYTVVVQDNIFGTRVYTTDTETVGELFEEQGITLGDIDILKCSLDDNLEQGMVINIKRGEDVIFLIDDKETYSIYMNVNTIGEALSLLKEEKGINYTLGEGCSSSQAYNAVNVIPVVSGYSKVETKIVDQSFETETVENPELEKGVTNVLTEGVNGSKEVVVRVNYEDGAAVSTEVLSEKTIEAPINRVVEIGTKEEKVVEPVFESPYVPAAAAGGNVIRQLVMNSSAYSIDYACTGKSPGMPGYGITASGIRAQYGVVAVDPRVIPLGTNLYVEGYGYCIAADTGGAIKGNKIDLCFNSYNEAVNYGRKNVNVYVLG